MGAQSYITEQQRAELSIPPARSTADEVPIPLWKLKDGLSARENATRESLVKGRHGTLGAIMITWEYPAIPRVRTPFLIGTELARRDFSGNTKLQISRGTDWMPIDTDDSDAIIELQVRSYVEEDEDAELYIEERRMPHLGLWLRLHDPVTELTSEAIEVFDFPGMGTGAPDIRMRGASLRLRSPHWEKLDELLGKLETHMGLAPQPAARPQLQTTPAAAAELWPH